MVTELGVKVKILRKNNGVKQEVLANFQGLVKGKCVIWKVVKEILVQDNSRKFVNILILFYLISFY